MTRIDLSDGRTADALELLGRVLEESRGTGLEALVESVPWRGGRMAHDVDSVVAAAIIAHDLGAPVLKVPVPEAPAGETRRAAVARVVEAVGVPVLFLGGPRSEGSVRQSVLQQVADVMAGGGAGMALGRVLYQDPEPGVMARQVADVVHGR
jgi:2-amino-4,5-dihydroxy-6-oxo-7-(phosphonooxy)heptanoate synthase